MSNNDLQNLKGRRLLLGVTGSIAAVKTPLLISSLVKAGAEVRCILTPSSSRLVSPIAISTLSRHRCYQNEDQWDPIEPRPLHIALAEWAEIIIVAPLSATTLSKWVNGLSEGLLASVLLASEKPSIAAAAMNTAMWEHPSIKNNWENLKDFSNVLTLSPEKGLLACNRIGEGKMVDPDLIELAINSSIIQIDKKKKLQADWKGKKLLTTAGATSEYLDKARFISNKSSGRMGIAIAQAARFRGAEVDLVHGPLKVPQGWLEGLNLYRVNTSLEMQKNLEILQPSSNVIAMAAAVADIRPKDGGSPKKLRKEYLLNSIGSSMEFVPDLLAESVQRRKSGQCLLGFAALSGTDEEIKEQGRLKKLRKGCDLIMANPIDRPNQGFEENLTSGFLFGPGERVKSVPIKSKLALAHDLLDEIMAIQVNFSDSN